MTFGLIATGQLTPWSRQSVFASSWGTGISYLFCMQAIGKASLCPLLFSTKGILGKRKRVGPAIPFCHTMIIVSAGTRSVLLKHPPNMEDQSERYPFLQFLPRCGKLVNQWAPLQDVPSCEFTQKGQLDKSQKEWRPLESHAVLVWYYTNLIILATFSQFTYGGGADEDQRSSFLYHHQISLTKKNQWLRTFLTTFNKTNPLHIAIFFAENLLQTKTVLSV